MPIDRRFFLRTAAALLPMAWGMTAYGAAAPSSTVFPQKPMTVIVPFPAGGVADNVVRVIAERLWKKTGQPVVVVNRPGASGSIAIAAAARAPRDGHTLFFGTSTIAIRAATSPKFAAEFAGEMAPLSETVRGAMLIGVNPELPVHTLQELIEYSKAHPKELNFGTSGVGSHAHFAFEFLRMQGLSATPIPFSGGPGVLQAVLQGEVQVLIEAAPLVKAHVESGAVRALAVTSRSDQFPGVPSLAEAGAPGLDLGFWMSFFIPVGSPEAAASALSDMLAEIVHEPEIYQKLQTMGYQPIGSDRYEFGKRLEELQMAFAEIARVSGMPSND